MARRRVPESCDIITWEFTPRVMQFFTFGIRIILLHSPSWARIVFFSSPSCPNGLWGAFRFLISDADGLLLSSGRGVKLTTRFHHA
jgi:hypothetical protein